MPQAGRDSTGSPMPRYLGSYVSCEHGHHLRLGDLAQDEVLSKTVSRLLKNSVSRHRRG